MKRSLSALALATHDNCHQSYVCCGEDDKGGRIAFGWVHDRRGFADDGEWLWGGDMCLPREIYAGQGDRLCARLPVEIEAQFAGAQR